MRDNKNTKSLLVFLAAGALVIMIATVMIFFSVKTTRMSAVTILLVQGALFVVLVLGAALYYNKGANKEEKALDYRAAAISRASRDIRTLMNSILNYSSPELTENYNPKQMIDGLSSINVAGEYLMTVVDDLMLTFDVSDDHITLNENPTTIEHIVMPMVKFTKEKFEEKYQEFNVEFEGVDKFRYVLADAPRVQQIILNLLTNANKYTNENGHITLRVEGTPGEGNTLDVKIKVKDDGIGIEKKKLDKLFDGTPTSNVDSGKFELGLSIVAGLVEKMNGTIECNSEVDKGSEFVVSFNWVYCNKDAYKPENYDFSILEGKQILVVEDNEMNAEITRAILEKKGMIMEYAKDGAEGVGLFTHSMPHTYSAILMDIRMPVLDGIEACKQIRSSTHPESDIIPIIAMTADVYEADYHSSTEAGMNGYITKPLEPEELYIALSNSIRS